MELKRLRYLVTVADEGSISAAARRLYMTQPPLSMQLRLLEEEVGCPLFERGARTVRLTEPGRRLVERARVLLEQEQAALREVRACAGEGEVLDLGVVSSVASTRLPQWLSAFAASGAPLRLRLIEADTFRLLDELRAGRVQLAIVRTPCRDDGLSRLRLAEEPLVAASPQPPAANTVTLEELARQPLLVYRRWEEHLRARFEHAGVPFLPRCVCDDARTAVSLARARLGAALVPLSAVEGVLPFCLLPQQDALSAIELLWRPEEPLSDGARRLIAFLGKRDERRTGARKSENEK